jgi:hypothetical protein
MKVIVPEGRDTDTPYKRFEKVAKALMAVPKKELDKEPTGHKKPPPRIQPKTNGRK